MGSPWPQLKVKPTNLYAPNCLQQGIPVQMDAGVEYTFLIQTRDFYSNNKQEMMADAIDSYLITYTAENLDPVQAMLEDSPMQPGVLMVRVTLIKAGFYTLDVTLNNE